MKYKLKPSGRVEWKLHGKPKEHRYINDIERAAVKRGFSLQYISEILGVKDEKYHKLMKNPKHLTVAELMSLIQCTDMNIWDLVVTSITDSDPIQMSKSEFMLMLKKKNPTSFLGGQTPDSSSEPEPSS